jgi:hypothetical protein
MIDVKLPRVALVRQSWNSLPVLFGKTLDEKRKSTACKEGSCAAGRLPTLITGSGTNQTWRQVAQCRRSLA